MCRTGCQWRALPVTFPAWTAVYYSFYHWQRTGRWQRLNQVLNVLDRLREGRPYPPWPAWTAKAYGWSRAFSSTAALMGASACTWAAQILTDSAGRIWAAHVHAAHQHDSGCGPALLPQRSWWMMRLATVLTDQAYRDRFAQHLAGLGLHHERASRPASATGFVSIAQRWVVERTFAWLTSFRRLALDYEFTPPVTPPGSCSLT